MWDHIDLQGCPMLYKVHPEILQNKYKTVSAIYNYYN